MKQRLLPAVVGLAVVVPFGAACHPQPAVGGPVAFTNEGAALAGTLSLPRTGKPPFPAVVLVHGSGRTTREDQTAARDHWLQLGFAVLAYDKRGIGQSTGDYDNVGVRTSPARMPLLGRDALAGLRALAQRPGIDRTRIGFYGISQAGWIIPSAIAAARPGEAAFAVVNSGPVGSVGQEDVYSVATGDGLRAHENLTVSQIDARVDAYTGPSGFDNLPALRQLRTPTLWLLGDADESIPVRHAIRNLRTLIGAGRPITLRVYSGARHGLFSPVGRAPFWEDVRDWLVQRGLRR
jgi:alpha-beta hydrolase superfamily lysophospholipase